MNNKKSLGKGLSAILGNISTDLNKKSKENSVSMLTVSEIETNPFQPRTNFNQKTIEELSVSIEKMGVIQPVTVRKVDLNKYQIISGERRLRASKIIGLRKIPAFIRIANDQQMLEMALVENIQREELNAIEIALSYKRLIEECKLTQEECSNRVGKNRTTITNFLRLLKLPPLIQKGLVEKKITTGHARALINVKKEEIQLNIFHDTIAHCYSVREVEELVKLFSNKKYTRVSNKKEHNISFNQQKMIFDLSNLLKTEINIKNSKKGNGKIIIKFANDQELKRILNKINE